MNPLVEQAAVARLAVTRRQLQQLFEGDPQRERGGQFPRSQTMRLLLRARSAGGGKSFIAMLALGLLTSRPALAFKLLRYVSFGALTRFLSRM
ncbi:MAG TPA: hypothetical protein VMI92_04440 [Steroidobacteraceae bacterium]|nr:hypothetical protein [Steroidobacteraceae bacterium]